MSERHVQKTIMTVDLLPILQERKISQRKFAEISGLRYATINELCQGNTQLLNLDNICIICEVLDLNPWDIVHYRPMTEEEVAAKEEDYNKKQKNWSAANKKIAAAVHKK